MKRRLEHLVIIDELNEDVRHYYNVDEIDLKKICDKNALNFEITNGMLEESLAPGTYEVRIVLPLFAGYEPLKDQNKKE